jgi:hypothetical protein
MKRIMSDPKVVLQNRKYFEANIFVDTQSSTDLESEPITQVQNANQLTEQQVQVLIYSSGKFRRITCKLTSISREIE